MKLKKVAIEAFRAYKNKVDGTFDFTIDGNMAKSVVVIKVVSDSFTAKAKQTQK